jgi:hypothetical protein
VAAISSQKPLSWPHLLLLLKSAEIENVFTGAVFIFYLRKNEVKSVKTESDSTENAD